MMALPDFPHLPAAARALGAPLVLCAPLVLIVLLTRGFKVGKRPTVAVVVSGAMRTLPECQGTVRQHVIDANPSLDFHFYVYVTVDDEAEVVGAQRLVEAAYPNVRSVLVVPSRQVTRQVKRALPGLEQVPLGSGTARGKAANIAKMLMGLSLAERLRGLPSPPVLRRKVPLPRINASGAASGASLRAMGPRHDLVLRIRPDLCFCRPLYLNQVLGAPVVHVPWHAPGMAFDQIAAGPPTLMERYAAAFDTTLEALVSAGRELYPESALGMHLEAAGVPLRPLLNFHASLARGGGHGGRVSFDDPYAKLKIDLPNTSFPAHRCALRGGGAAKVRAYSSA